MARDARPQPFPFPIPDPPVTRRVQLSTPFPPPPLPPADQTANLLARRVAGVPLPMFFAIGAVVGIVLALTVVTIVRRVSPKRATQAKVVSVQAAPLVEHAHALFVWPPATAHERAASAAPMLELDEAAPVVMPSPMTQTNVAQSNVAQSNVAQSNVAHSNVAQSNVAQRNATPTTAPKHAAVAMNRPRALPHGKPPAKREAGLPNDLLSAGL